MGLVLAPMEVKMKMSIIRGVLNNNIDCYKEAQEKVQEFVGDDRLNTRAWAEMKDNLNICYRLIVEGILLAHDSIMSDMDTLDGAIGNEYLDEDELQAKKELLEIECKMYESNLRQLESSLMSGASGVLTKSAKECLNAMIERTREEIAILQEKIDFLKEAENNTKSLFMSAFNLFETVSNIIRDGKIVLNKGDVPTEPGWLKADFISDCVEGLDDFEEYLIIQGFPEGYRKYLMILHEKYPEWQFEAIETKVDYQEFVNFQINNDMKCAENSNPNYCTNRRFTGEKSPIYYIANSDAITFFSNPYSLLQTNQGSYENAMQFLKAGQELPQEYVNEVTPKLLKGKEQEVVDAIINSNSCINPVFMASVYVSENGPSGVSYNGKIVYNFFNVGANSGRDDALKYAYEHKWFSPETCINGSEETFQNYIDNGQDTLYALDWDFQTYAATGTVGRQYATLVNDAENKAINLCKSNGVMYDLNQKFVFKIPVYENIPAYGNEEYGAFPDPNK